MGKFEERLWSIIRNFIVLGRSNPALLVSAVRVVEMQETVDKQIAASGKCAPLSTRICCGISLAEAAHWQGARWRGAPHMCYGILQGDEAKAP